MPTMSPDFHGVRGAKEGLDFEGNFHSSRSAVLFGAALPISSKFHEDQGTECPRGAAVKPGKGSSPRARRKPLSFSLSLRESRF